MFALGALDDLLHLSATTKLIAQTIIAAVVVFLMPPAHITGIAPVDGLLSLVWIVGITNAFNLLDNIDGLSAGIAAIAGMFFLAALAPGGGMPLTLAVSAFVGASLGFLIYNARPASIFMGDSGSLFLGAFLGGAALLAAPELKAGVVPVAAIPLFILLVPIFDTAFVSVTRRLAGRSPLLGGRDHLSHRLVAHGHRRAARGARPVHAGRARRLHRAQPAARRRELRRPPHRPVSDPARRDRHRPRPCRGACGSRRTVRHPPLVSDVAYQNRVFEVLLDLALLALAYYAAFRFRFQGEAFTHFLPLLRDVVSARAGVPARRDWPWRASTGRSGATSARRRSSAS